MSFLQSQSGEQVPQTAEARSETLGRVVLHRQVSGTPRELGRRETVQTSGTLAQGLLRRRTGALVPRGIAVLSNLGWSRRKMGRILARFARDFSLPEKRGRRFHTLDGYVGEPPGNVWVAFRQRLLRREGWEGNRWQFVAALGLGRRGGRQEFPLCPQRLVNNRGRLVHCRD